MKLSHLFEGGWVIKNFDGVPKTFKDRNSEAARAWGMSRSKKKPTAAKKFTQTWWEDKNDGDRLMPWDRIDDDDITMEFLVKSMDSDKKNIDHWSIIQRGQKDLTSVALRKMIDDSTSEGKELLAKLQSREDLPTVATAIVRVAMMYFKEDDLGHDKDVEEGQLIKVMRDPENPKKIVFGGYTW